MSDFSSAQQLEIVRVVETSSGAAGESVSQDLWFCDVWCSMSSQCHSGHGRTMRVVDQLMGKAAYMEWSMRLVPTNKVSLAAAMPL